MEKSILITGSNSFIARSIIPSLRKKGYNIIPKTRQELNLMDFQVLAEFFYQNKFSHVIHTASTGGRRNKYDDSYVLFENTLMMQNLLYFRQYYENLITFTSGSEFNKDEIIFNHPEECYHSVPTSFYGLAKYINTQILKTHKNVTNLRLFNVFSDKGMQDSFVYTAIRNSIEGKPIEIFDNIYYDTFSAEDLTEVIDYFILNPPETYEEINCVYPEKYKLSEISKIIKKLTKSDLNVIIREENKILKHYCGDSTKLKNLNLPLTGIYVGLNKLYRQILEEKDYII